MANRPLDDGQSDFASGPSEVQVTIIRSSDDRGLLGWLERHPLRIPPVLQKVAFTIPLAIVVAMFVVAFGVGASGGTRGGIWGVRDAGPAGVAAAYGYPRGCLRVRISGLDPRFARADFARPGTCGYAVEFPTAVFHRFGGEWHPVLYTVRYPCPVPTIPPPVQSQLALCPGHGVR